MHKMPSNNKNTVSWDTIFGFQSCWSVNTEEKFLWEKLKLLYEETNKRIKKHVPFTWYYSPTCPLSISIRVWTTMAAAKQWYFCRLSGIHEKKQWCMTQMSYLFPCYLLLRILFPLTLKMSCLHIWNWQRRYHFINGSIFWHTMYITLNISGYAWFWLWV